MGTLMIRKGFISGLLGELFQGYAKGLNVGAFILRIWGVRVCYAMTTLWILQGSNTSNNSNVYVGVSVSVEATATV